MIAFDSYSGYARKCGSCSWLLHLSAASMLMHMISSLLHSRFVLSRNSPPHSGEERYVTTQKTAVYSRLHDFLPSLKRKGRDFLQPGDEKMELQSDPLMSIHVLL